MGFLTLIGRCNQSLAVSSVGGVGFVLSILSRMQRVELVRGGRWSPTGTLRKREPPDPRAMLYNVFVTGFSRPEIVGQKVGICLRIFDAEG
jgi:hypothetical protein